MSNSRIDNIMHKNTYNTSVNKKLDLQEDIEKLEEQKIILNGWVEELSEKNDTLQEKHEELLMKQTVGYDGWEDDLEVFQTLMEEAKDVLEKCAEEVSTSYANSEVATEYSSTFFDLRAIYWDELRNLEEHCSKHPVLVIKSKDYLERSSIVANMRSSLDNIIDPYIKKSKELDLQLKATKKKEEEYKQYLSEERSTGWKYFLAGVSIMSVLWWATT